MVKMNEFWKRMFLFLMSPVYGRGIINAFDDGESCVKENYDRFHAKTALQRYFFLAKKEIVLLCGKLSADVYENSLTMLALSWAYSRNENLKVTVYVRSNEIESLAFRSFLLAHGAELYIGVEDSRRYPYVSELVKSLPDFCLVDGIHVREEIDKDTRAAKLLINKNNRAESLQRRINRIKSLLTAPQKKRKNIVFGNVTNVCNAEKEKLNVSFTVPSRVEKCSSTTYSKF